MACCLPNGERPHQDEARCDIEALFRFLWKPIVHDKAFHSCDNALVRST